MKQGKGKETKHGTYRNNWGTRRNLNQEFHVVRCKIFVPLASREFKFVKLGIFALRCIIVYQACWQCRARRWVRVGIKTHPRSSQRRTNTNRYRSSLPSRISIFVPLSSILLPSFLFDPLLLSSSLSPSRCICILYSHSIVYSAPDLWSLHRSSLSIWQHSYSV